MEAALLFRLRSVLDQLINELFRMADSVFTAKGGSCLFLVVTLHGPSPDRWEKCLNNRILHATMFHRNLRCGLQEQENAGSGPGVRSGIEAAASAVQAGAGSSLAEPRESVHRVGDLLRPSAPSVARGRPAALRTAAWNYARAGAALLLCPEPVQRRRFRAD
jgi:hypothetical protein